MNEFIFELATPADDPAIRRLLANNPVPGRVTVTYEREPNYFLGCGTMGHFCQVLVARHQPTGEVAAVASRSTRPLFVNGRIEEVGYIGQLRIDERFRGRWVVSGGFRFFHQLHADGRVVGYLTTIIEGNTQAQGILVDRARRHFPIYREVDRLCTLAIILRRPHKLRGVYSVVPNLFIPRTTYHAPLHSLPLALASSGHFVGAPPGACCSNAGSAGGRPFRGVGRHTLELSSASPADLPAIIAFLRKHGSAKQFFPAYTEADFSDSPTTLGFRLEDFVLARQKSEIVGVIGLWDQSSYKQTVVQGYNEPLRWLRPIYNAWLRLSGAQPLPPPDQPIHFAYASFICLAENNPDLFGILLQHMYNLAVARGYTYLMVGLSIRDPLLSVARRYTHIPYYSRLYTVCWPGEEQFHEKLDQHLPYVEIATL